MLTDFKILDQAQIPGPNIIESQYIYLFLYVAQLDLIVFYGGLWNVCSTGIWDYIFSCIIIVDIIISSRNSCSSIWF